MSEASPAARLCAKMAVMTPRYLASSVLTISLLAIALSGCLPRPVGTLSDLDGDGVLDSEDQCMADPEDFDGFEDDDGCAEDGVPGDEVATDEPVAPAIKTEHERIKITRSKALAERAVQARVSSYQKAAQGARVDTGERGAVVFGFGKSWVKAGSKSKRLPGDVSSASFSPDGRYVALVGAREFLIIEVAKQSVIKRLAYAKGTRKATETKLIRMLENGTIVFFDGCQLHKTTLESKDSEALGERHCGDRPRASADGNRWFAWQQLDEQVGVFEFDLETGARTPVLGGTGDAPGLSMLKIAPSGEQLCYSRHRDGSRLTCRNLASAVDLELWEGPTDRRAAFAADGTLGFGAGARGQSRDFYQADLGKRRLRLLGTLGPKDKWINAVGPDGFVASGGPRLRHFDLAAGEQLDIALGDGEWEGFAAIPGKPRQFIVGKEGRGTRDLYRIVVP